MWCYKVREEEKHSLGLVVGFKISHGFLIHELLDGDGI
jgi:hypothetical protein